MEGAGSVLVATGRRRGAVVDPVLTMACPQGRYNLVMGAGVVVVGEDIVVVVEEEVEVDILHRVIATDVVVVEAAQVAQLAMEEVEAVEAVAVVAEDMVEAEVAETAPLCTCTRPLQQQEEVEAVAWD